MAVVDQLVYLPVEQLQRGAFQPRRDFEPEALAALAQSLHHHGMIEPIIARRIAEHHYEIIAGERRWRAAQLAALPVIPCILRDYSNAQAAEVALIENLQRENLNPIETAHALSRLLVEFNYTQAQLATIVSQSRTRITNSLRLLLLHQRVQQWLIEAKLTEGHGKMLAGLSSGEQLQFATECVQKNWSVRHLENEIKKTKHVAKNLAKPPAHPEANKKYLTNRIAEYFNTEVMLDEKDEKNSGWIKIKYYDNDTLCGILNKMGIREES